MPLGFEILPVLDLLQNLLLPLYLGGNVSLLLFNRSHANRYIDNRACQRQQSDDAYAKKPLPQAVLDLCKDGFVPDEGYDTQDSEDPQDPHDPQDSSDTDSE